MHLKRKMRIRKNSSQHTEPATSRSVADHLTVEPWSTANITYGYALKGGNEQMNAGSDIGLAAKGLAMDLEISGCCLPSLLFPSVYSFQHGLLAIWHTDHLQ